ncbi:MAG: hypothetical protein COA45_06930 [Zetaproteobacteria bacterium]|nr:MAG: hypothetical protein COA45_06930 [Zetaproteobacteria bacterium]
MGRQNETPRDRVYAICWKLGFDEIKRRVENSDLDVLDSAQDQGYVFSWLGEETEKRKQEERIMEALSIARADSNSARKANRIAWVAACASLLSAVMAFLVLLYGLR